MKSILFTAAVFAAGLVRRSQPLPSSDAYRSGPGYPVPPPRVHSSVKIPDYLVRGDNYRYRRAT